MSRRIIIESRGYDQCVYEVEEIKTSDLIDRNNKKEPLINLFLKQDKDDNKERRKNMLEVITTANDEIIILKEGDLVNKQDVIGLSGKNNLSSDIGEHLHFELIVNGQNVNPEKYYGKTLEELNK